MLPLRAKLTRCSFLLSLACAPAHSDAPDPVVDFGGTPIRVQSNATLSAFDLERLTDYSREELVTVPPGTAFLTVTEKPNKVVANLWAVDIRLIADNGDTLAHGGAISIDREVAYEHAVAFLARRLRQIEIGQ